MERLLRPIVPKMFSTNAFAGIYYYTVARFDLKYCAGWGGWADRGPQLARGRGVV